MTHVAQLLPVPGDEVDADGAALEHWLAARYAIEATRFLRLNLVTGLGGQIAGASGTSAELSDGIDQTLMRVLRRDADVLLVGAATVRSVVYPTPTRIPLAIATASGDLAAARLPQDADPARLLVLHPASAAERVSATAGGRVTPVVTSGGAAGVVDALHALGFARVLCEGGGGLASALFAAQAVTEFAQTIAPVVASPFPGLLSGPVPPRTGRLVGLLADGTDRLYARWRFPER